MFFVFDAEKPRHALVRWFLRRLSREPVLPKTGAHGSPFLLAAIRCDPTNVRYLWERSHLHMQLGEQKHCMDGYRKILSLLPTEEGEHFMQLSKDMAK